MFYQEDIFKNCIQRLKEKINEWNAEKILLYGAGEHSRAVLKEISWGNADFLGFLDRAEQKHRDGFLGFPVYVTDSIEKIGAAKIIISSFSFQEDIYKELIKIKPPGVEIIKLYSDQDFLRYIKKKYAYCPDNNDLYTKDLQKQSKYILPSNKEGSPRILLIQLPFPVANHRHKRILPMNLIYLAAYSMRETPDALIRILDGQAHNLTVSQMKYLITRGRWDIIGIGYWTAQTPIALDLSRFIRKETKSLLIHGGVHPTLCAEESAAFCDLVIMNEGERTFSEIVKLFPDRDKIFTIHGIAYQDIKKRVIKNPPRPIIEDLDSIPFPAFNLISDLKLYDSPMHVTGGLRVPLIGSRGCPYACTFCSSPLIWNRKVRWRAPAKIADEMEEVISSFNITQFHFWDDNIMLNARHIQGICEEIINRGLSVHWCGLTRATHVNKHKGLLPLMKKAGCVGIEIGIESFTEHSTHLINKGEGVQEMREAGRNMEEAGIAPLYTHMLFNPGEDINGYTLKQNFLDEIDKKNTAYLADSRLGQASTPHRKTDFERQAKKMGEVYIENYSHCVHQRINFIPYSLLNDIPVKITAEQENPLKFLEIILQAIFDWDNIMIDQYLEVSGRLWKKIDGKKSVRQLCHEIGEEMRLDDYKSKVFVCLSITSLARSRSLRSNKHEIF